MKLTKEMEDELYSFIVDSNLEHSIVNQCENKETAELLAKWFQISGDEEGELTNDMTIETCPHCENEVSLKAEMDIQKCPKCSKQIKPCSLCDMDIVKCEECPLGEINED